MTAPRYLHDILQPHLLPLMQWLQKSETMLGLRRQECHKTVSALLLPFLGLPDPQICFQSSISRIIWDVQLEIQTIETCVTQLKTLASTCEFVEQENGLIRDRIVLGIKDSVLQRRLLRENNLNMEKSIEIVRAAEAIWEQIRNMKYYTATINFVKENQNKPKPQVQRIFIEMNVPENELVYIDSVNENETKCAMENITDSNFKNVEIVSETTWYKNVSLDVNNKCFDVNFKLDTGADVNILPLYILNNAVPVIHPPRRVPLALQPKLKKYFRLAKDGIVSKVNKPTDWVQILVIVEKPNGNLRLCLDPRDLNKVIKREHYQIPCTDDIISRLEGKKIFSVVDLKDGFWHVPLNEISSEICTFNTPFGKHQLNKMPFGIISAPEVFQKRNQKLLGDIEGVEIYFDDIIVAGCDEDSHDAIMSRVLERAKLLNIKFNPDKLQYRVSEVKYLGQTISKSGIKPDPDNIKAIVEMPIPKSKTEILWDSPLPGEAISSSTRPRFVGGKTATAGSDVVQSGRPIFDDFFQHLWPYIGNNTANVVFQMVKRLWLIRIDQ
ncbi:uncharacterized protein K02A2.6 [Trichonephila clavipes]|nr:uncharacterized protein K02A2.6 [Trichonephila clavipes]